jgi:sugar (pentulose or hexulose) kinase
MVPGLLEGTYNVSGFVRNAGKFHHWLKEKLVGPRGTYEDFATLANDVIPGISQLRFIPPELSGGTFKNRLNVNDAFIGMTGETSRGEMVLAFFEYVCFALRRLFEEFSSHAAMIGNVRSSGGLSKCATFNQLKATMIGKTISVSAVEDAELVGNAIVACVAAGEYRDYHEAVYALVRFKTDFVPDATLRTLYDELFEEYKKSPESSHR